MKANNYTPDTVSKNDKLFGSTESGSTANFIASAVASYVGKESGSYENYKEINISSTEIKNLATTSKNILPFITDSYYEWKIVMEITSGSTPFNINAGTTQDVFGIASGLPATNAVLNKLSVGLGASTGSKNAYSFISSNQVIVNGSDLYSGYNQVNQDVYLYKVNGINYTQGNGTMLLKVWYSEKQFGSNL